jgi:hypothetical protein
MKKLIFLLTIIISVNTQLRAQLPNTFTTNHPTVANVKVSYKQSPQTSTVQSSVPSIPVIPQVTVSLVPGADVAKIYLKIIEKQTNTLVYQINYMLNSAVVLSNNGQKLFENDNGYLFISSGEVILLKKYEYQIITETSQQVASTIYSIMQ